MENYTLRVKNGEYEIEITADHLSELRELIDDTAEKFFPDTSFLKKKMKA